MTDSRVSRWYEKQQTITITIKLDCESTASNGTTSRHHYCHLLKNKQHWKSGSIKFKLTKNY